MIIPFYLSSQDNFTPLVRPLLLTHSPRLPYNQFVLLDNVDISFSTCLYREIDKLSHLPDL